LLDANSRLNIVLTTGTQNSARLMAKKLPSAVVHQYAPLDHPIWVTRFMNHWRPDAALWMESELWPHMLLALRSRKIPSILVNARLSPRAAKRWASHRSVSEKLLACFDLILTQNAQETQHFETICTVPIRCLGNIKYSAPALPIILQDRDNMIHALNHRPIWLYASSHDGEEIIAGRIHLRLKKIWPNILTMIIPRHPERRTEITQALLPLHLNITLRGNEKTLPSPDTDIYIADTLGELGVFYSLSPLACIGRSLSSDGGGGHNPIEPAQLGCFPLNGPHIQNLHEIYADMQQANACMRVQDELDLYTTIHDLLSHPQKLAELRRSAQEFANQRSGVITPIMAAIRETIPWL
jgi:3-deoxy-D-manno-octulosonic-acid transferase